MVEEKDTFMGSRREELSIARYVEKAISDEWFAHFQYWIGSILVADTWEDVIAEFVQHSSDEYDHATDLAYCLHQTSRVGKVPLALDEIGSPRGAQYCGYIYPMSDAPQKLIEDALKGERCAVIFYKEFLDQASQTVYKGDLTRILEQILLKEEEHVRDLENLQLEI